MRDRSDQRVVLVGFGQILHALLAAGVECRVGHIGARRNRTLDDVECRLEARVHDCRCQFCLGVRFVASHLEHHELIRVERHHALGSRHAEAQEVLARYFLGVQEFAFGPVTHDLKSRLAADHHARCDVPVAAGEILVDQFADLRHALEYFFGGGRVDRLLIQVDKGLAVVVESNGRTIKTGEAYEREFERYVARLEMEKHPDVVAKYLETEAAKSQLVENRLVATLALDPKASASRVAHLISQLGRAPGKEEILRLAQFLDEPGVSECLKAGLQNAATQNVILENLLQVRNRLDAAKITPLLSVSARQLLTGDASAVNLGIQVASSFQILDLEGDITAVLQRAWIQATEEAKRGDGKIVLSRAAEAALRALREMRGGEVELFAAIAKSSVNEGNRNEALAALAASKDERGATVLLGFWPDLNSSQRRTVLDRLTGTKSGAQAVVQAIKSGGIAKAEVHGPAFDKMQTVLGDSAALKELLGDMAALFRPCLRLNGADNAWAETDITLDGPFTVETWVKLDAGIDNNDGILGATGVLDMNFAGEQFRVFVGGDLHDVIIAKKKINPEIWTHIAVTRDAAGKFRIYQNGELDNDESKTAPQKFEHCQIGWTLPSAGTAGWLSEFRVWNRVRTPEELRAEFDRSYESEKADGLVQYYSGTQWGKLRNGARVEKTQDFPALMTAVQSQELASKFSKFRLLADQPGDAAKGKVLFTSVCQVCHAVGAQGGQIGPVLSGAGAMGVESLLRNIITPNAQMEPGYRVFRIELKDGDVLDGRLMSEDKDAFILRRQGTSDLRVERASVLRSHFPKTSMMPEGLLEALKPEDVSDLFAYLKTLK